MSHFDSRLRRIDRTMAAAMALLLHRNGPDGHLWGDGNRPEVAKCVAFAVALNAEVEKALGVTQSDPFTEDK